MTTSFYELTVNTYLQMVTATTGVLAKGNQYCADLGKAPDTLLDNRLHPDMADLHFQIVSVHHHSLGAIRGMQAGEFSPPDYPRMTFTELQAFLDNTLEGLNALSADEVNALEDGKLTFKGSSRDIEFSNVNFALSFSLPNLYFHATTAYDLLRAEGVSLGKMDYLGRIRTT